MRKANSIQELWENMKKEITPEFCACARKTDLLLYIRDLCDEVEYLAKGGDEE